MRQSRFTETEVVYAVKQEGTLAGEPQAHSPPLPGRRLDGADEAAKEEGGRVAGQATAGDASGRGVEHRLPE